MDFFIKAVSHVSVLLMFIFVFVFLGSSVFLYIKGRFSKPSFKIKKNDSQIKQNKPPKKMETDKVEIDPIALRHRMLNLSRSFRAVLSIYSQNDVRVKIYKKKSRLSCDDFSLPPSTAHLKDKELKIIIQEKLDNLSSGHTPISLPK